MSMLKFYYISRLKDLEVWKDFWKKKSRQYITAGHLKFYASNRSTEAARVRAITPVAPAGPNSSPLDDVAVPAISR